MLGAIVALSTLVRIAVGSDAPGPWIFVDEMIYSSLGRSAFDGGTIRGVAITGYGVGYPTMIAPAYALFENLIAAFAAVKALNALAMSLAAVPVYFTARIVMNHFWSLGAALLAVLVPAMAYSSVVMTESAFYPAFCFASMLIVVTLNRPTIVRQISVWGGIAVCFEIRSQGGVLAVALGAAVVALVLADALTDRVNSLPRAVVSAARRYWLTFGIFIAIVGGIAFHLHRTGKTFGSLLGAYSVTAEATDRYNAKPVIAWVMMHLAELDLWLGVVPAVALLVLIGRAVTREGSRELRVFAISAVAIIGTMTIVVGAFVVFSNVGRIEERNLFYVGVFPLVALCWWISQGAPRDNRWFMLALVIAAGLPLALPYPALINQTAASDTFGLYLPWAVSEHLFDPNLTVFAVAVASFGIAAFTLYLHRERVVWLVFLVVIYFIATSVAVDIKTDRASAGAVAQGISGHRDWIDQAVGANADVSVIYPGSAEPLKVWQNEFFNRAVHRVYTIAVPLPGGLPETIVNAAPDGRVIGRAGEQIRADLVLVHESTVIAGTTVATDDGAHMNVVRATSPLRFLSTVSGIYDDGWTAGEVLYSNYACKAGSVETTVRLDGALHSTPVTVTPFVGDIPQRPVQVSPDGSSQVVTARVSPGGEACSVRYVIEPVAIPSQVTPGVVDSRPLGVLMSRPVLAPS